MRPRSASFTVRPAHPDMAHVRIGTIAAWDPADPLVVKLTMRANDPRQGNVDWYVSRDALDDGLRERPPCLDSRAAVWAENGQLLLRLVGEDDSIPPIVLVLPKVALGGFLDRTYVDIARGSEPVAEDLDAFLTLLLARR